MALTSGQTTVILVINSDSYCLAANTGRGNARSREYLPGSHVPSRQDAVNDLPSHDVGSAHLPERVRAVHHRETEQAVNITAGDPEYNSTTLNPWRHLNPRMLSASAQNQKEHQPTKLGKGGFHGERTEFSGRRPLSHPVQPSVLGVSATRSTEATPDPLQRLVLRARAADAR